MTNLEQLPDDKMNRRQWIPRCARAVGFAAMGAFGVGQVLKGKRLADDPNCIRLNTCNDCIEFDGCALDKAEDFRQSLNKIRPEGPVNT